MINLNGEFDIVIEGIFKISPNRLYFKASNLDIPQDSKTLIDRYFYYEFYGYVFNSHIMPARQSYRSSFNIPSLSDIAGVLLPHMEQSTPYFLETPRSVSTRDKRIFIERTYISRKSYMELLPLILRNTSRVFERKNLDEFAGRKFKKFRVINY